LSDDVRFVRALTKAAWWNYRPSRALIPVKESVMASEPKRQKPDIPPQKPDIQPEPTPQEIPQDKDVPEKQSPPMQL
jgi:hypothetical protein